MIIRCVCVCAYVYVCVSLCVCGPPPLLAGVRWQAGHVTGCQLAFCRNSHTVHYITISWWAPLKPVSSHTLWCAALMSHTTPRPCWLKGTLFYPLTKLWLLVFCFFTYFTASFDSHTLFGWQGTETFGMKYFRNIKFMGRYFYCSKPKRTAPRNHIFILPSAKSQ